MSLTAVRDRRCDLIGAWQTALTQNCPPEVHSNETSIERTCWMIVIGADTHKRTHALAAIDADTGQLLGEREITATE